MKTHSNLVPPSTQQKTLVKGLIRSWSVVCACLLVLTACAGVVWRADMEQRRDQLESLSSASDTAQSLINEMKQVRENRDHLRSEYAMLLPLSNTRVPRFVLGSISSVGADLSGRIQLDNISLSEFPVAGEGEVAVQSFQIHISGLANDDSAIEAFVESLRSTKLFDDVDLRSTQRTSAGALDQRVFQVQCVLIVDLGTSCKEMDPVASNPAGQTTEVSHGDQP